MWYIFKLHRFVCQLYINKTEEVNKILKFFFKINNSLSSHFSWFQNILQR